MNFLGMGPMELVLILALALIVFGPQKLPEIGGQIGRAVRDFRRTTSELSEEFNRNLQLELDEQRTDGQVAASSPPSATVSQTPAALTESGEQPEQRPARAPRSSGDEDLEPPY